jgi:hypothetical protein
VCLLFYSYCLSFCLGGEKVDRWCH